MIKPEMIPKNVARKLYDLRFEKRVRAADVIAAALNAWPGMRMMVDNDTGDDAAIKLPMPQEPSDE